MSFFSKIKKGFKNTLKAVGLGGLVGANSIQRTVGNILPTALSAIPTVGPALSAISRSTDFQRVQRQPIPVFGPGQSPPIIPPVQGFLTAPSAGMSALPAIARGAAGLIRTATGKVSKVVLPSGATFSRKKAAALIRKFGMEAAAVALGITVVEAAEILLTETQTRRRGRGISAAQLRNAKRVNCTVARMARDLGVKPATRTRRTSCR